MLQINDLKKSFGNFCALEGLSMHIENGQLYGFVGPNGAGKTTTMKIIAGLLAPDSGNILLDGIDIKNNAKYLKKMIGYMPDFFGIYDNLRVKEYMEFFASTYQMDKGDTKKKIIELLALVGLSDKIDAYVDGLSRGMKQRLCLARTMVHSPKLLILDEPASGMEPRARLEMQRILKELTTLGTTILVSSHILTELSEMCSNIGIIEKGKLIIEGTIEEITAEQWKKNPIEIQLTDCIEIAVKVLKANSAVSNIAIQGKNISINFIGTKIEEAALLKSIITAGVGVSAFKRADSNLETIFLQLTK